MNKNPFAIAITIVVLALAVWSLIITPQLNSSGANATSTLAAAVAGARGDKATGWVKLGDFSYYNDRTNFKAYEPAWINNEMSVHYQPIGGNDSGNYSHNINIGYEALDQVAQDLITQGGSLKQIDNYLALVKRQNPNANIGTKVINGKPLVYSVGDSDGFIARTAIWLTNDKNDKPVFVYAAYYNIYGANRQTPAEKDIDRAMSSVINKYQTQYPNKLVK